MIEINITDIRRAIQIVLDDNFGINIEVDEIKQGFKEPCFFIKTLSSAMDKEMNRRYSKNIFFDIHYFTDKKKANEDCELVADKLYELLDIIDCKGSLVRSKKRNHKVVANTLHFFLEFDFKVMKEIDKEAKMESLDIEGGLKND